MVFFLFHFLKLFFFPLLNYIDALNIANGTRSHPIHSDSTPAFTTTDNTHNHNNTTNIVKDSLFSVLYITSIVYLFITAYSSMKSLASLSNQSVISAYFNTTLTVLGSLSLIVCMIRSGVP